MKELEILQEEIDYYFSKIQSLNDDELEHLKFLIHEKGKLMEVGM